MQFPLLPHHHGQVQSSAAVLLSELNVSIAVGQQCSQQVQTFTSLVSYDGMDRGIPFLIPGSQVYQRITQNLKECLYVCVWLCVCVCVCVRMSIVEWYYGILLTHIL